MADASGGSNGEVQGGAASASRFVPGTDLIGSGYDPFGGYASIDSVKSQFFDWRNAPQEELLSGRGFIVPAGIDVQWIGEAQYAVQYGTSFESLRRQLANRANLSASFLFFSSSFSSEFSSDQLTSSESEFTRIQETQRTWALRLTVTPALRELVKAPMKSALKAAAIDRDAAIRFFDTYGSHILAGLVMGGRCIYSAVTDRTKIDRSTSVRRSAEVGFQFTRGSGAAGTGSGDETTSKSFQQASRTSYFVSGGDLGLYVKALGRSKEDLDALAAWISSVTASPTFVDFYGSSPLIGVWTLCEDQADRDALEAHFNAWARQRSMELQIHPDFITDIKVVVGDKADIPAPAGYKMVPGDLNACVGGKFVYVCYRTARHTDALQTGASVKCVTDIILTSKSTSGVPDSPGDGWVYEPHDLNEGAGGSYLYLGYRKADYRPVPSTDRTEPRAIRAIKVVSGKTMTDDALEEYELVGGDLNDGIANAAMYLFVTRGPQATST